MHTHVKSTRCERCQELEEEIRQLRKLITPGGRFPLSWSLTNKQTLLLSCFLTRSIVTRDAALAGVYGADTENDIRIVDVYMKRIRERFRDVGVDIKFKAEYGLGYSITAEDQAKLKSFVVTD